MAAFLLAISLIVSRALSTPVEEYKGKEDWGYINVRENAYIFWWLYRTDAEPNYMEYPLVVWLQGGPGAASTGYGNFQEIGPYDQDLKFRNTTWVKRTNVLFLDQPVGTGFSYVTHPSALCHNQSQIISDLMVVIRKFLQIVPAFQVTPLFLFAESYGGKMAADFSLALYRAMRERNLTVNFKGVAFGNSWISAVDSVMSWGQFLYTMSLIGKRELSQVNGLAEKIKQSVENNQFTRASKLQSDLQEMVLNVTHRLSFYNVLKYAAPPPSKAEQEAIDSYNMVSVYATNVGYYHGKTLTELMNSQIREKLQIIPKNVTWSKEANTVFKAMTAEFMRPVVASVDAILQKTDLGVYIYSGQLDLICNILGTRRWMARLNWPGIQGLNAAPQHMFHEPGNSSVMSGSVRSFKQLHFFRIFRSGHMVPQDNGVAALQMLDMILSGNITH